MFEVTRETFMNRERPLTELYERKDKKSHFVDTVFFGVILSKTCHFEKREAEIKKELHDKIWPRDLAKIICHKPYIKLEGNKDSVFRVTC